MGEHHKAVPLEHKAQAGRGYGALQRTRRLGSPYTSMGEQIRKPPPPLRSVFERMSIQGAKRSKKSSERERKKRKHGEGRKIPHTEEKKEDEA